MSKSILIINTPDCCAECKCLKNNRCIYDEEQRLVPFHGIDKKRTDWCPLVPLEKVCDMAVEAYKEEKKIEKENTILCDECYEFFDKRGIKTITEYSDKWFTDVNEKGYRTDWRYVYVRGRCPHCGKLNLLNYYTESREYDAD